MNGIFLIVPVSRWWNLRMKRKIIYKQNVWEYDQFDLFYIYIIPLSLSFSTKFTVFSKGNNLFGCPRRSYDKRDFDRSTCLWMLNYCAWRLSINNYILNFLLEYLELSVLFIQRPFFSSFWWLLDKSTSRKYASFRRCHCGKIFLCCSCLCTVWLCSALPSSLWYILWVLQLVCPSLKEESFNGKKNLRSCLIVLSSKRRRYTGCRPHSWLSTRENCLAKFIFVFLFGFLKDKAKQDGLRTSTKTKLLFKTNSLRMHSKWLDALLLSWVNFHIFHGRYLDKW